MIKVLLLNIFIYSFLVAQTSDSFPAFTSPPTLANYPATTDTFYCSPTGSNTTGDGSIGSPWHDFIGCNSGGAGSPVTAGSLIYFRHGTGADTVYDLGAGRNFAESDNKLTVAGTEGAPIMITNYPGEIARWETDDHWSLTLAAKYQKVIATQVSGEYGITVLPGGWSVIEDFCRVSGVEFSGGTYNGGDGNPSMLSVTVQSGIDSLHIDHCKFRDSAHPPEVSKMAGIRFFISTNPIIEYNIFEDNTQMTDGSTIYFKDNVKNIIIRNNVFVNNIKGIQYFAQNNGVGVPDGMDIYNNLFFDVDNIILFRGSEGGTDINIYNNVALSMIGTGGFIWYNYEGGTYSGEAEVYDNVIDGSALDLGWHGSADNIAALPDLWDYNLYYASADTNDPFTASIPTAYYGNAVVTADEVTYNSSTQRATVETGYSGEGVGRTSGDIGGFLWESSPPPTLNISVRRRTVN